MRPLSAPVVVREAQQEPLEDVRGAENAEGEEEEGFVEVGASRNDEELDPAAETRKAPLTSSMFKQVTRAALSNLEDLKTWISDDSSKAALSNRVSAATRQRALRKTLLKISKTRNALEELEKNCNSSGLQEAELERELKAKEEARYDTLNILNATASELKHTLHQMKVLQEKYDALESEKAADETKLKELEDRSKKTLEVLNELEVAYERTEKEKDDISEKYRKMVETEQKLKLPELRQALSTAVTKVAKYEKSIEQSQKIIAKITADNLVFLTKFKDAEEKYRLCEMKREELQTMVDEQKGPWFDKVKGDIQKQIESDYQKIHKLENEISMVELESKQKISKLEGQLESAEAENKGLRERETGMRLSIKNYEEKDRQREESDTKKAAELESLNQLLNDTMAENKVLRQTITEERHTVADSTLECQNYKNTIEAMNAKMKEKEESLEKVRQELQSERWALQTQRRVNKELMGRKEEIEWKLMELTVKKPLDDVSRDGTACRQDDPEDTDTDPDEGPDPREERKEGRGESKPTMPKAEGTSDGDSNHGDNENGEGAEGDMGEAAVEESSQRKASVEQTDDNEPTASVHHVSSLTEKNLKEHRKELRQIGKQHKKKNSDASVNDSEKEDNMTGAKGKVTKEMSISELENTITGAKQAHQDFLDSIYPSRENVAPVNPFEVHKRIVTKILDRKGPEKKEPSPLQSIPHLAAADTEAEQVDLQSSEPSIASMLQGAVNETSTIGELEASIALAKDEYAKMMSNFSSLVDNLKTDDMPLSLPGCNGLPVLPESIQRVAEHQFRDHWVVEDDAKSTECNEKIRASEIKVSDWLDSKIDEEWKKQFVPDLPEETL